MGHSSVPVALKAHGARTRTWGKYQKTEALTFDRSCFEVLWDRDRDVNHLVEADLSWNIVQRRALDGHVWRVEVFDAEFTENRHSHIG